MENFIVDLDRYYVQKRKDEGIPVQNNRYTIYLPVLFESELSQNDKFIVRKRNIKNKQNNIERKTQFIYTFKDARVYFTDYDIIEMLMDINDEKILQDIISQFKQLYEGIGCKYRIELSKKKYEIYGIKFPIHSQMLKNRKDIPMEYADLMVLIILILAKDQAAAFNTELQYHKRTLAKYISLLEWYKFNNRCAMQYLGNIGFPWNEPLETNFENALETKRLHKLFPKEEIFEKSGLL